jgi:hypothetical protein
LRFQLFFLFIAVVVIPALSIGAVDNVMEVVLRYLLRPIIDFIVLCSYYPGFWIYLVVYMTYVFAGAGISPRVISSRRWRGRRSPRQRPSSCGTSCR